MAEPRVSLERHTREDPHRHDRGTGRRRTDHRRTAGAQREGAKTKERVVALRNEVVTLMEQFVPLTWRTLLQPSQPSSLLIGSRLVRNVSRDKLAYTDVICLPGGKLPDVKRKVEQQPSGFDTITVLAGGTTATCRHHPLPRLLLRPTSQ